MCLCCWNVFEKEKINAKSERSTTEKEILSVGSLFSWQKETKKKTYFCTWTISPAIQWLFWLNDTRLIHKNSNLYCIKYYNFFSLVGLQIDIQPTITTTKI